MSTLTPMSFSSYEIPGSASFLDAGLTPESVVPAEAARSTVKRLMDIVGSVGGLILLMPILVVIGLLIRLESRGPILFRQQRTGFKGQIFWCLKFRTMVPDAEQRLQNLEAKNESAGGVLFKIKDDPRITPLGRFLRKTSLDEFPQLWNVLVGEMSLVGPRPLQLRDSNKLEALSPTNFRKRLAVSPGITGPWQVSGRSELDSHQMLNLDLDYVTNWSILADLKILHRTIAVVLARKGAC